MEVWFSSHIAKWRALPQSAPEMWPESRMVQTGSRRQRLSDLATPLCCGMSHIVRQ